MKNMMFGYYNHKDEFLLYAAFPVLAEPANKKNPLFVKQKMQEKQWHVKREMLFRDTWKNAEGIIEMFSERKVFFRPRIVNKKELEKDFSHEKKQVTNNPVTTLLILARDLYFPLPPTTVGLRMPAAELVVDIYKGLRGYIRGGIARLKKKLLGRHPIIEVYELTSSQLFIDENIANFEKTHEGERVEIVALDLLVTKEEPKEILYFFDETKEILPSHVKARKIDLYSPKAMLQSMVADAKHGNVYEIYEKALKKELKEREPSILIAGRPDVVNLNLIMPHQVANPYWAYVFYHLYRKYFR
jgi:hypothetical protein